MSGNCEARRRNVAQACRWRRNFASFAQIMKALQPVAALQTHRAVDKLREHILEDIAGGLFVVAAEGLQIHRFESALEQLLSCS